MTITDNGKLVEIHSSTYPDNIMGIYRKSTDEHFGCVVCVSSNNFNEEDYTEYIIIKDDENEV